MDRVNYTSIQLDQLPLEILQNIAGHSNARAVLALCRTNRHLRAACWNHFVLRQSLEEQQGLWSKDSWDNSFDIDSLGRCIGLDVEKWARFALADQCAFEIRNGAEGGLTGDTFQRSLSWAPHLIVCQHPIVDSPWLAWALAQLVHRATSGPVDESTIFWYAAAMISSLDESRDIILSGDLGLLAEKMSATIYQGRNMWKTFRALGSFAFLLREAIKNNKIVNPHRHHTAQDTTRPTQPIYIPSTTDIPLLKLQKFSPLSPPFDMSMSPSDPRSPDWANWLNRCNEHMSSPDFMIDGEWCGYYSQRSFQHVVFDLPMINIKFELKAREARESSEASEAPEERRGFHICGRGTDAISNFKLSGEVFENHEILLTKAYSTHRWIWKCTMTPFGIFGNWYSAARDNSALGAVWLWKRNWQRHTEGY